MPGQQYDTVGVPSLIKDVQFGGLLADKAFDIHSIRDELGQRGARALIPQRKNRLNKQPFDKHGFKARHLIENYFCKLKEFKRIAMRAEKTDQAYAAMIYLTAGIINSQ